MFIHQKQDDEEAFLQAALAESKEDALLQIALAESLQASMKY